ncbi:MAG TPA: RNA polymerase sigma-70 factor [Sphingobacteriaceae bacterium]
MEKVFDSEYLVQRLKESDPVSFKMIYKLYWRRLYNTAYHIIESDSEAEDIVQDVFSSLWYRREHLCIKGSIENYLVKAVKYTAFFYIKLQSRKRSMRFEESALANDIEDQIAYKDLEHLMKKILDSLPFKTREIFSLSRFEGLTYSQIAERMDVSVKTVEYHISLALKKFSKRLAACLVFSLLHFHAQMNAKPTPGAVKIFSEPSNKD